MLLLAAVHFSREHWSVTAARLWLQEHGMTAAYDLQADRDYLVFPQLPAPPRAGLGLSLVPLLDDHGRSIVLVLSQVGALSRRVW